MMRRIVTICWHSVKYGSLMLFASFVLALVLIDLPESLDSPALSKVLLDRKGALLGAKIAVDQQWRFPSTESLPPKYVTAVLAFEDRRFYSHPGINPFAIVRAVVSNYKAKRVVSGGSTITMQLARILRGDPPRSYENKFIEMLMALKLELRYSKNEILTAYASLAPFGGNTVGINAASWRYFGLNSFVSRSEPNRINQSAKQDAYDLLQLSWAQAALLAVLPNSPALMHPGRSREKLKQKRDRLLAYLHQEKLLSATDFQLAVLEPLPNKPKRLPQLAPHLLQSLVKKHESKNLFHSTIDINIQAQLNRIASLEGGRLQKQGINNLSMLVINNNTMELEAYLGNYTRKENNNHGKDVDIATRPRSTGSILKPLLYGLMLKEGQLLPNTLVADVPSSFMGFTPENYDHKYRGAVPASQALAKSLNIPAVHMLKNYGVGKFQADLQALGMSTLFRAPSEYGLSLILGGAEGNLLELSEIYAQLILSARTLDSESRLPRLSQLVDEDLVSKPRVLDQGAAWLTLDALMEVTRPGVDKLWKQFNSNQKIAWKTGTSYGLRDAWAIGSNGLYTVGIWAGNAGGEGVAGLSGLNSAAPSLFRVFETLDRGPWIEKPVWALKELKTCVEDGYLAVNNCEQEISYAPRNSHFQKTSPYHQYVYTDSLGTYRVHGGCERVANMEVKSWMILPPLQAHYWRQYHNEYRSLPPWREECVEDLASYTNEQPMALVYPLDGAKLYIPTGLNGEKESVVLRASHRMRGAKIFWHINGEFLGETSLFHKMPVNIEPGWHKLTLVDELGIEVIRWFKVISQERA